MGPNLETLGKMLKVAMRGARFEFPAERRVLIVRRGDTILKEIPLDELARMLNGE